MTLAPPPFVTTTDVYYPESDGMPMAESDFQRKPLMYAVESLNYYFAGRPDVYVSGNIFLYYEEDNPKAVVAPDVLVAFGVEKRDRSSYFVWKERGPPDWVLEVTSRATRSQDQGVKYGLYAFLGVREYFQFDPTGDYVDPPLKGYRLAGRNYEPIPGEPLPGGRSRVPSAVLGLDLWLEDGQLAFYDPRTGEKLLTYAEAERARREAEARADREAAARAALEARVADLEARLRGAAAGDP